MYLIQFFLPTFDNEGQAFAGTLFAEVSEELTKQFGGVTAFVQSPAIGLWKEAQEQRPTKDQVLLMEVMVEKLDREWWRGYRGELERRFRQDLIVVRALACEQL